MGKFNYEKGDIRIVDSECRLCIHYVDDGCAKGRKLSEQVTDNDRLCPYFERKRRVKW